MKRVQNHYSQEFKFSVVQDVLTEKYSKEEARRIYGIRGKSSILEWIRQFSGHQNCRVSGLPIMSIEDMKVDKEKINKDERIRILEDQLRRETLRADLYEKMVDVAEDKLKIKIRKKSGAK